MDLVWHRLLNVIYNILTWFWITIIIICFIVIWLWVYNDVFSNSSSSTKSTVVHNSVPFYSNKSPRL